MIRRHDGGGVVADAVGIRDLERAKPEQMCDLADTRVAGDGGPRPPQPLDADRGRGERLQRVECADTNARALLEERVEDVEAA